MLHGIGAARARADRVDSLISELSTRLSAVSDSVALVALGAYGRRELTPRTEVELLFLYQGELSSRWVTEVVCYPLWEHEVRVEDPNGKVTNYSYLDQGGVPDPLWRLRSVTDPLGNATINTYSPNANPPTTETSMTFNSSSISDMLTTYDGVGHPILRQNKQSPTSTNYDTVAIGYDLLGRQSSIGMPCVSTASVACSSPSTTMTYDALCRPTVVSKPLGALFSASS